MRMWAVIWRILTLRCDASARLISASLDQDLPWFEQIAFRLHAVSCRSCRHLFKQISFLRSATTQYSEQPTDSFVADKSTTLPAESRKRIEQALREANNRDDN